MAFAVSMLMVVGIAALISLVLTPLVIRLAWKCGAVAWPDKTRKLHARPTALWGGAAVFLGASASMAICVALRPEHLAWTRLTTTFTFSAGMLCLLGCCDDRWDINARWKLLGQIGATLPMVLAGFYVERLTLLGHTLELGWLGPVWTIGWLVLGINALNLLDGMDGLASTVGIAASAAIAITAATIGGSGSIGTMFAALAIGAALLGFVVHNLPPARIYLGDCGSMLLGFGLAFLAQEASAAALKTSNVTLLVALLFLPLFDTHLAIVRRTLSGQSFMVADRGHVHHRLLDRGLSIWGVLALLGTFCLFTGGIAWGIALSGAELWAWGVLGGVTLLLVNRQLAGHAEWQLLRQVLGQRGTVLQRRDARQTGANRREASVEGQLVRPPHIFNEPREHPVAEVIESPDEGKKAA